VNSTDNGHPLPEEHKKQLDIWTQKVRQEYEEQRALKTNYDALIFAPHDLEGTQVELDAEAFELITSWGQLPAQFKASLATLVRIYLATASAMEASHE
jgi:hypothetical protein